MFTPFSRTLIHAPGTGGGASYGPLSYSPRRGYLPVNAIDQPTNAGRAAKGYLSAYDPATGELAWRRIFDGWGQAGSVVIAGDVVFVGTGSNTAGYFFAYDAKKGGLPWRFNTGAGVFSAVDLHGQRRTVRHRRLGRRREGPARRGPDPDFRAAAELTSARPTRR